MSTEHSFTRHNQTVPLREIIAPKRTETSLRKLAFDPKDRAAADAFADEVIRKEKEEGVKFEGGKNDISGPGWL